MIKAIDTYYNGNYYRSRLEANLRLANPTQSTINRRLSNITNKSGYKGVFYVPHANKWRAQINTNGNCVSLGYFDTAELGYEAYKKAAIKLHGEYAKL